MDLNQRASSPDLSYDICRLLINVRPADAEAELRVIAEALLPGVVKCVVVPVTDTLPAFAVIIWPTASIILIDGTTISSQALAMLGFLESDIDYNQMGGINTYYYLSAQLVFNRAVAEGVSKGNRLIVGGHSLGAPIAEAVCRLAMNQPWAAPLSCVTFGAPRPGVEGFARIIGGLDLVRWMNQDDPVPQIPPRQNQAPAFFAFLSQKGRLNANRYVQPHGGILLRPDGTIEDLGVEVQSNVNVTAALGAWMSKNVLDVSTAHNLAAYLARLGTRIDLLGAVRPVDLGSQRTEPSVHRSGHSIQRDVATFIRSESESIREANNVPVMIPELEAFTATRKSDVWVCRLRGTIIAIGPTRRRARHLASLGNIFLRKLQVEGSVDIEAFGQAFAAYLSDASNPAEGFSPVMRIS